MTDETGEQTTQGETPATFATWDEYIGQQLPAVQELSETHITGLKSALTSEREERKRMAKELRDATSKLEAGSETAQALDEISQRYEQAERRAGFYEEANRSDVGCVNPRAAFLVANAEGLFSKRGDPDWKAIKAAAPELFQRSATTVNAGAGTGSPPPTATGMNEFIRRAAGRG